jgi:DNA invertase Pin-like site-specific DNA recombinase
VKDAAAFLEALKEIADAIGCEVLAADEATATDVPLRWRGKVVGALRPAMLHGSLQRLISGIENDLGAPLNELGRAEKQAAVRLLNEQGAFLLRGAVEDVAERIGVSRITIYKYLNAIARVED